MDAETEHRPPSGWYFVLALVLWATGNALDPYRNPGVGILLFASVLFMAGDFESTKPSANDTFGQVVELSVILWPGTMWAVIAGTLVYHADSRTACTWLLLAPLLFVFQGFPIVRDCISSRHPLSDWRIATGLVTTGILAGHIVGHSSIGDSYNAYLSSVTSPFVGHGIHLISLGGALMLASAADMMRNCARAVRELGEKGKLPTDTWYQMVSPPRGWYELSMTAWTGGLAMCVGSMLHKEARVALIACSVGSMVTMAVFPPFAGRVWLRYDDWIMLLFGLQAAAWLCCWLYEEWCIQFASVSIT
jgi:hypothetical protein